MRRPIEGLQGDRRAFHNPRGGLKFLMVATSDRSPRACPHFLAKLTVDGEQTTARRQ